MKNYMFFMISSQNAPTNSKNSLGLLRIYCRIYCLTSNFPCAISFCGEEKRDDKNAGGAENEKKRGFISDYERMPFFIFI
jgi:hypothetical protein